jgi:O-antigen ligase/Flp pilus assembly protein TadD
MNTEKMWNTTSFGSPKVWFLFGLAVTMLALWFPFIPNWQTFIHMWRVEVAASILLLCSLGYVLIYFIRSKNQLDLTRDEWKFIVLPILAFILWSLASALWADSWKSALHHSFIWSEYLIFYLIFRRLIDSEGGTKALMTVFVLTLVLYSLPAIFEYCAYLSFGGKTSIGIRFAKYGEQVVTLLPLLLLGVIRTRGKSLVIGSSAVVILWLLVFCSVGRANYLLFGCAIICLFALVCISKRYRQYAPRFALLTVILLAAPLPLHVFSLFSTDPDSRAPVTSRFSNVEALNSSNNFRKLMISVGGDMIRDNPIVGIGADNFGLQLNSYRQAYGAANPNDPNLANAEDQIPNHAHNEFLQIAAEVGIVGLGIFAWLLVGIFVMALRSIREVRTGSLYPAAAVLGLGMFLASSLVSSYSFRVMQSGIVFFFVLAIASKVTLGPRASETSAARITFSGTQVRFAVAAAILACIGLVVYSAVRVSSVIITAEANRTTSTDEALPLYQTAMKLDDEKPDVRHNLGMRLLRRQRYADAVPFLEAAISIGRAPSSELSYLATAKALSGDTSGAEATMKFASELYPRSPFVLTRYSTLLESNGKQVEAAAVFRRAVEIDERAAKTWQAIIVSGPKVLSEMAARDDSYMQVTQLSPESSVYAVVTERYIRHPDEQRFSLFKAVRDYE